jgi:hypothetical protein
MMNERMQTKYMTVLEDMYLSPKFKLQKMRIKNEFAAMKKPKKIVVKILWGLISYEV